MLRNNEYYDFQAVFDNLYAESCNGRCFRNLMELIRKEENILLAYRNIKKNKGSHTKGVDGKTITYLEPVCEAKFFKHSYGFRPLRSAKHAIARAYFLAQVAHLHYVVDIDIKGFFDNIDHGKLLKQLWTLGIEDKSLLRVISKMLKAEIDGIGVPAKGTPQGGILSPLLANVVLNELDWWIASQWERHPTRDTIPAW